jgi:hypothetical protein
LNTQTLSGHNNISGWEQVTLVAQSSGLETQD